MALKAISRRTSAKTLSQLLADVFTASKLYNGTFYPENFRIDYNSVSYEPGYDWDDELKPGEYHQELNFSRPFNCQTAEYCCGLLEIGNLSDRNFTTDPAINSALMRVFMTCLAQEYNMVMATTIASQKIPAAYLAEAGFTPVAEYKSKGTGSIITVWFNELGAKKELPPGHLNLDDFEIFE